MKNWSFRFRYARRPSMYARSPSFRSRYLRTLTSYLTLFDRKRTASTARIPFVRSSPESPMSPVLISRIISGSSSFDSSLEELSQGSQSVRQYSAGSGLYTYLIGSSGYSITATLGCFSNFLERMEKDFSTTCISALHSLMVSAAGSDMLCKVSVMRVSSFMFDSTLAISPYRQSIVY